MLAAFQGFNFAKSAVVTSGNVTWTNLDTMTVSGANISNPSGSAGYHYAATSVQSIRPAHNSYFSFKPYNNSASNNFGFGTDMFVALMRTALTPATASVMNSSAYFRFNFYQQLHKNIAGTWTHEYDGTLSATDTITLGFDGSNHLVAKQNGTAIWTDASTTTDEDYCFVIYNTNHTPGATTVDGLYSVTYQQ